MPKLAIDVRDLKDRGTDVLKCGKALTLNKYKIYRKIVNEINGLKNYKIITYTRHKRE